MKKKVLFMIDSLEGGGAEKVLVDIVKNINKEKYDITVCSIWNKGVYIKEIQEYAKYIYFFNNISLDTNRIIRYKNILKLKIIEFFIQKANPKLLYKHFIKEKYDIEIAFLEAASTKIISTSTNKKSRKIAWVHIDLINNNYINMFYRGNYTSKDAYMQYDQIVCVSESVKKSFIELFNLRENVTIQYNPVDEASIIKKSQEEINDISVSETFKIISVGRLVNQKGYDRLLQIHNRLIQEGYNYELWILGEGIERKNLESYIEENSLDKTVKLIGFQKNPYKYMKACDLYISSSRAEGYSLVIAEAMINSLPIISTDCAGPNELLNFGEYGILTENNTESLYKELKNLLDEPQLLKYYTEMSIKRSEDFSIEKRMIEIEKILDRGKLNE